MNFSLKLIYVNGVVSSQIFLCPFTLQSNTTDNEVMSSHNKVKEIRG